MIFKFWDAINCNKETDKQADRQEDQLDTNSEYTNKCLVEHCCNILFAAHGLYITTVVTLQKLIRLPVASVLGA